MKSNLLRVEVSGGLANQIFMLLGGKWIADEQKLEMTIVSLPNSLHSNSLFDFNIPFKVCKNPSPIRLIVRILRKVSISSRHMNQIMMNCGLFFTEDVGFPTNFRLKNKVKYISGYFQSYKIHMQALKGESVFDLIQHSPSKWAGNIVEKSVKPTDIAIHVRLGDYINEQSSIGLVGLNYYNEGIRKLSLRGGTGTIRVITNDITECKKYLAPLSYDFEFLEPPKEVPDIDSLFIMSRHKYLVLANSSFSLLAGLESKSSIIIRPTPWFKSLPEPLLLSPPEWISLPSVWR